MKRNEIRKKIKYAYSENSKIKFNNFKDSETNEISLKISENSKNSLNSFDYNLESPKGTIQKSKIFAKKVLTPIKKYCKLSLSAGEESTKQDIRGTQTKKIIESWNQ